MNPAHAKTILYPLAEWLEDLDHYTRMLHHQQELATMGIQPPESIPWIILRPGLTRKMYEWRRSVVRVAYLYLLRHLDEIIPGPEISKRERELTAVTQYGKQLWPWVERHGLSAHFYHLPLSIVLSQKEA